MSGIPLRKVKLDISGHCYVISKKDSKLANAALARFFFRRGLSLGVVNDDDFRYFCFTLCAAYKPPSIPTLSGPLLDQQYNVY